MSTRNNMVVDEEDFSALTIMKPFSQGYMDHFITVFEDAYGEVQMKIIHRHDLIARLNVSEDGFTELLRLHKID